MSNAEIADRLASLAQLMAAGEEKFVQGEGSPDRLDLSSDNARAAAQAGVRIAISTDAHSTREFGLIRYGLDQARRAGLAKSDILNCLPWNKLCGLMKR